MLFDWQDAPFGKKCPPLPHRNFNYLCRRAMLELHLTAIGCIFLESKEEFMSDQKIVLFRDFLSQILALVSRFEFNTTDEVITHVFTLLSSSIELFDNMCVLALNDSKAGVPILLRTILESSVDIEFILLKSSNYKRLKIEELLRWQGIYECVYRGNTHVAHLRQRPSFESDSKNNASTLKELRNSGVTRASMSDKFKSTLFAEAYDSIYAVLCSYSHNGTGALDERHITTQNGISRVNLFKETTIEECHLYLLQAASFLHTSLESINQAFQYGLDNEIDALDESLMRLAE
jgi:Family of unknown function (DUF5677)